MSLMRRRRLAGLTLIELMAVVVIIAILAAVAVPIYIAYTRRAHVSEAVAGLGSIRSAEQIYFAEHNVYLAASGATIANDPSDTPPGLGLDFEKNTYFDEPAFSVVLDGTYDFIATADGSASTGPRADDVADYKVQMRGNGETRYDYGDGYLAWN